MVSWTLNHATYDVYSPKVLETYTDNVMDTVFFIVCKIYFLLVLSKGWIQRECYIR